MAHASPLLPTIICLIAAVTSNPLSKCQSKCGDVSIPYPFGITKDCIFSDSFYVLCNTSSNPHKPYFFGSNIQLLDISLDGHLRIRTYMAAHCGNMTGKESTEKFSFSTILPAFRFSHTRNKFVGIGCDTLALIEGIQEVQNYTMGCMSICSYFSIPQSGSCNGIGCCEASIPPNVMSYKASASSLIQNRINIGEAWDYTCRYSMLVEEASFQFQGLDHMNESAPIPTVVDWAIDEGLTCEQASMNLTSYACKENSYCVDSDNAPGYRCMCLQGYQGNPYLPHGCEDIDECADRKLNNCVRKCINTKGNYTCSCPKGYHGDGWGNEGCTADEHVIIQILKGCSPSLGIILAVIGIWWTHSEVKRRKNIKLRSKFFEKNGGLLFQQQMSSSDSTVETTKLFTSRELERATDYFNENRILGRGGQGTVYKGMLTDGRIVAVKTAKILDTAQLQQFINEVVILSQIKHRNIVKILGCCLETEVPLLVYEFVPNGTLFQQLHDPSEEYRMTWNMRFRIATEVANALFYLHSAVTNPIYHRDIKSTNILLDDKYRAKIADFGISRSVAFDQTHVTTRVQGTFGYLDPEYFRSGQLTDKSDVYSFGVVLVELLTGLKPVSSIRCEQQKGLASFFQLSMAKHSLLEILDVHVAKEAPIEAISAIARLAKRCLNEKGKKRPTMKQVAFELEKIRASQRHQNEYDDFAEAWEAASSSATSRFDSALNMSIDIDTPLFTK